jgi:hypothetical protein
MIIQEGRNSGRNATLLPAGSAAISFTVCNHNLVNINSSHPQLENIPEECGASSATSNRAGTISPAVEIPADSIIDADLYPARSVEVGVVEESEVPRRHDGDEEGGEECELHGEELAVFDYKVRRVVLSCENGE